VQRSNYELRGDIHPRIFFWLPDIGSRSPISLKELSLCLGNDTDAVHLEEVGKKATWCSWDHWVELSENIVGDGVEFPGIQDGWAMSEHKLKFKTLITIALLLHLYGFAIYVQDFAND
jgi:hypothetical protein